MKLSSQRRGEEEQGRKHFWGNNGHFFSKSDETFNPQIQEAQWALSTRNMVKLKPRHIAIQTLKISDKEKMLRAARDERHYIQRNKEWEWQVSHRQQCKWETVKLILKELKEKKLSISLVGLSFKNEGKKEFLDTIFHIYHFACPGISFPALFSLQYQMKFRTRVVSISCASFNLEQVPSLLCLRRHSYFWRIQSVVYFLITSSFHVAILFSDLIFA